MVNRIQEVGAVVAPLLRFLSCLFLGALLLFVPRVGTAEESTFSDFEHCVVQEYEANAKTPETAYQIGECFYQIVHQRCAYMHDAEVVEEGRLKSNVSAHIILQYADSWFVLAAKDGHEGAVAQLAHTRKRLEAL